MKPTSPLSSTTTGATSAGSTTIIDVLKTTKFVQFVAIALLSLSIFFFATHFASSSSPFSSSSINYSLLTPQVSPPFSPPSPPPAPPAVRRTGIIDENGAMSDEFIVGESGSNYTELSDSNEELDEEESKRDGDVKIRFEKFKVCEKSKVDYIPCLDNEEAIKVFNHSEKGEKYERHCPAKDKMLDCLVPRPEGYQKPIPWPQSRDEVWFSNVPHTRLVEYKGGQNWISIKKDKFIFPGGGTQFIHGADQYLNQISQMVPEISFGRHIRVVLDVGCGVASFGAFLLQRNVTTLSVAPKDVHENQIQFALERGVPAMVAVFATHRLLYPSQSFDLIHCSRCRINWTRDDGILLLEANRMLRAGGYFVWAAQPVYKHEEILQEQWKEMEDLTTRICWELVKKEGYIAIWRKPLNNSCYLTRDTGALPPLCGPDDNVDNVWFAAALLDLQIDCWVMNVVPVSGFNTLSVIYDRGLIGVMHDWCEPFDTYPRTYDLLHAAGLFSIEKKRCNMSTIMLEMDRMLRPGGRVYIRDSISVMGELQEIATALRWVPVLHETSEGPHASWKILISEKRI